MPLRRTVLSFLTASKVLQVHAAERIAVVRVDMPEEVPVAITVNAVVEVALLMAPVIILSSSSRLLLKVATPGRRNLQPSSSEIAHSTSSN